MNDTPDWPNPPVGPKDSIVAIGVVSVNYSRLETVLARIFAAITGSSLKFTSQLFPKITNAVRIELMTRMLEGSGWPEDQRDKTLHFIKAFDILAGNRNRLMHSNLIATTQETTTLYKVTRQGNIEFVRTRPERLRQVADDMMTYVNYGLHLSSMISPQEGDFAHDAWPDKPPLPIPLEYTKDLQSGR
jgi:hypothetical protein